MLKSFLQNIKSIAPVFTTQVRMGNIKKSDIHRMGAGADELGDEGEKVYHFKGGKIMDAVLPTIETLTEKFDGTMFKELPIITIRCSKNNTRIFIHDFMGNLKMTTSSRVEGFKNCKKKTTVAGQATGVAGGLKALRRGFSTVRVVIRGLGPGRMTGVKGLTIAGVNVVSITDFSILPEKVLVPKSLDEFKSGFITVSDVL